MSILLILGVLAILTLVGVSIPFAMAAATFLYFFALGPYPIDQAFSFLGSRLMGYTNNYALLIIPMFVFYGRIAEEMNARSQLAAMCRRLLGTGRIGAAAAEIISGLAVPDAAGEALLNRADTASDSINRLRLAGVSGFAATAQSAALTLMRTLMPPGIIVFVLAIAIEESIARAWIGLAILGLLIGGLTLIFAAFSSSVGTSQSAPVEHGGGSIWLITTGIVVSLLVAGVSTPTEAAAIAVSVAIVSSLFSGATVYRLLNAAGRALQDSGMIFFTILLSGPLATAMALEGTSTEMASFISELGLEGSIITVTMFVAMALVSSILGSLLTVLVTIPLFFPVTLEFGLEPTVMIMLSATAVAFGSIIPPLGPVASALTAGSSLSKMKVAAAMGVALVIGLIAILVAPIVSGPVTVWIFDY